VGILLLTVALALVVPPFINVNRYKNRVTGAISRALGRDVTVSNIEMKLLPRPGVVLYNFVAADDPSYGAEPMLRADTVTAYLRLTSLWRGRLEIGTLNLDNPSLNLVRRSDGHWNVEELVERTSHVNPAPTAEIRPEARPRFPYVQASSGRINFKLGDVKKAFAFTDADFALWLESENSWGIRMEARPVRTDVNISDTGTLNLDGHFQRAAIQRNTPIYLKLDFNNVPLGQLTKLMWARDRGWRGDLRASAVLTGSPAALQITLDTRVDDFRRYDIATGEALRLKTHCTGTYSSSGDVFRDVRCESPVGSGSVRVIADAEGWGDSGSYQLDISGEHIPAERVIAFARHAKKDLPPDLTATGEVEALFTVRKSSGSTPVWAGGGRTNSLVMHANLLKPEMRLGEVDFDVPPGASSAVRTNHKRAARATSAPATNSALQIAVQPFAMPLGAASPASGSADFDLDHYSVKVSGAAELGRLLNVAQAFGIGTPGVGLAGQAQLDVAIAGQWVGFAPPVPQGKLQIHTATAELQGVSEPLLVNSAAVTLDNQLVKITSLSAGFSKGIDLSGSADFPVHCTGPENCGLRFDLHADDASLARLDELLNPSFGQPWYNLLAIGRWHQDALMKLRASGHFSAARFELGNVTLGKVNGSLKLSSGNLRIDEVRADLLGGHHDGSWMADFNVSPPKFVGNGTVRKLSVSQLASLMHDSWAAGSLDAEYNLALSGMTAAELLSSAAGTADFSWIAGSLRHVSLDGSGTPVAFSKFSGKVSLQNATFTLADCKMRSTEGTYIVKGTASYDRTLALQMDRPSGESYVISGTLDEPQVQTVTKPAAEASLR
jgi:hypothetical protein